MTEFSFPTQYVFEEANIEGVEESIQGLIQSLHIFENIYYGGITGHVVIADGDSAGLIKNSNLEFVEGFTFKCKNSLDEVLEFDGYFNGLRNEQTNQRKKLYTIDFVSKSVRRNNCSQRITKSYSGDTPSDIADEMTKILESEVIGAGKTGEGIFMTGGNRTPLDVMKFVCNNGVATEEAKLSDNKNSTEQEVTGSSGFFYWETLDGHRFASIKEVSEGKSFNEFPDYYLRMGRTSKSMDDMMNSVLDYEFPKISDFQNKLESGALKSRLTSLDMDTGKYSEVIYTATDGMTEKQKELALSCDPQRVFNRVYMNEDRNNSCEKAKPNEFDKSRKSLQLNSSAQHTFSDQHGKFTLPPRYSMRAGDLFEVKIASTTLENMTEFEEKHSGKYIIKQVAHHMYINGQSYTKISTIRNNKQQNDQTS